MDIYSYVTEGTFDAYLYGEIGVGLARGIDKDGFDCWYCVQVFLLDGCEVTRVDTPANK